MRGKGMLMALAFVIVLVLIAWLTGDKGPFGPNAKPAPAAVE